jgi:hypothetical protein
MARDSCVVANRLPVGCPQAAVAAGTRVRAAKASALARGLLHDILHVVQGRGSSRVGAVLLVTLLGLAIPTGCLPENYLCSGPSTPCGALDESTCSSDSNGHCEWQSGCETACVGLAASDCGTGVASHCLSYPPQCFPPADDPCSRFSQSDCGSQSGCQWADRCRGGLECPELHDEAQCNQRLSCSWQPANL